jgi:SAF domain
MTTTMKGNGRGSVQARDRTVRLRPAGARRRPGVVAAGALLVVVSALAFAAVVSKSGDRRPVLVVARDLPAGTVLIGSDLMVTRIAAEPGLRVVPAASRSDVVGRTLAVPVRRGTLLVRESLGEQADIPKGEAVIGVALKPGQFPPALRPGARVMVVDTASSEGSETTAVVLGVDPPDAASGSAWVVSLRLSESAANRVVTAATAGRVALVQVAQ